MELVHANHFVSLAGVGHQKGRAYGYRHLVEEQRFVSELFGGLFRLNPVVDL